MTAEEALAAIQGIEKQVKSEGCTDVSELIEKLHEAQAEVQKATTARDSFADEVKEMKKNLGSKGGELGFLKQKVRELEEALEQANASGSEPTTPKGKPTEVTTEPPKPSKPIGEQVAEVEALLTDDQWNAADQLLTGVEDDELARKLALPTKERLEFLQGLSKDVSVLPRPKTLRPQKPEQAAPPNDEGSLYERLKKTTSVGPMGGVLRTRQGYDPDDKPIHRAFQR